MLETILLNMCVITVMPAMAYLIGDIWNIIKRDFNREHWFTEKKGDLL